MDISTLDKVLVSYETALEGMLKSLSNNVEPEDVRAAVFEHIARTTRIVHNALQLSNSPVKYTFQTSFTEEKRTPFKPTPAKKAIRSETTTQSQEPKSSRPVFTRSTPRKRYMSSSDSDGPFQSSGGPPNAYSKKTRKMEKHPFFLRERSPPLEPSHRRDVPSQSEPLKLQRPRRIGTAAATSDLDFDLDEE